ncbi:MAG: hypothetical protein R6W70_10555 [bacterium]
MTVRRKMKPMLLIFNIVIGAVFLMSCSNTTSDNLLADNGNDTAHPDDSDTHIGEEDTDSISDADIDTAKTMCLDSGDYSFTVEVGSISHAFSVHIPDSVVFPAPAVLLFHGGGSTGFAMDRVSGLSDVSDKEGFILFIMEGWSGWDKSGRNRQIWNAGACCVSREPDHVGAVDAMLDRAVAEGVCYNENRVFATGHSNGSMMAYRLACELSHRIAAIAASSGAMMDTDLNSDPPEQVYECTPDKPVSILHVHGHEDLCAPYIGGVSSSPAETIHPAVEDCIQQWRDINDCDENPVTNTVDGPVRRRSWSCAEGTRVELIDVQELGHAWAGTDIYGNPDLCGGSTTDAVSTTEELWRFFSQH